MRCILSVWELQILAASPQGSIVYKGSSRWLICRNTKQEPAAGLVQAPVGAEYTLAEGLAGRKRVTGK